MVWRDGVCSGELWFGMLGCSLTWWGVLQPFMPSSLGAFSERGWPTLLAVALFLDPRDLTEECWSKIW